MRFDSFVPSNILRPYILRFVISEQEQAHAYKVLPDTSLVIGFQYKGRLAVIQDEIESPLSASGITGLQNQFKVFKNAPNTGTLLVYFKEMGAACFFKQPLHEIFAQSISMDNLISATELAIMEERIGEANNDAERIAVIEQFLTDRLKSVKPDLLVAGAVQCIRQLSGDIKVASLAKQLHTSQSPLEKRFRKLVGASPKKYASIIRLQTVLKRYPQSKSFTDLGHGTGYFDQAHFIKDFKTFTGETPEQYFAGKNASNLNQQ